MKHTKKAVLGLILAGGMTLGLAAPAFGTGDGPAKKCNSGRGNGSELINGVDCDPGNSGGHNQGGD
jgi:hypothetical protein